MRPFGCPVTILNTLDHLGKFDGKLDEGFFVGYSVNSKAFRLFNTRTKIVVESLHITFLENKPNVAGSGPAWLFDIDFLTNYMNYMPVMAENQANSHAGTSSNGNAGTRSNVNAGQAGKKVVPDHDYILLPLWGSQSSKSTEDGVSSNDSEKKDAKEEEAIRNDLERMMAQEKAAKDANDVNSTNTVNTASILVNTASIPVNTVSPTVNTAGTNNDKSDWPFTSNATSSSFVHSDALFNDPNMSHLEDIGIFGSAYDDRGEGAEADTNNLEPLQVVSLIPSTRVHKDHPKEQILGDLTGWIHTVNI
ncbi:putative ribonuclease H-like domain-containing protein [Tanacetum coccineum]